MKAGMVQEKNLDWWRMLPEDLQVVGSVQGLEIFGRIRCTNGIECILENGMDFFPVHLDAFKPRDKAVVIPRNESELQKVKDRYHEVLDAASKYLS